MGHQFLPCPQESISSCHNSANVRVGTTFARFTTKHSFPANLHPIDLPHYNKVTAVDRVHIYQEGTASKERKIVPVLVNTVPGK